jgi:hypothetical protein
MPQASSAPTAADRSCSSLRCRYSRSGLGPAAVAGRDVGSAPAWYIRWLPRQRTGSTRNFAIPKPSRPSVASTSRASCATYRPPFAIPETLRMATHEVLLKAYRALERVRPVAPAPWLLTLARHTAIDCARRQAQPAPMASTSTPPPQARSYRRGTFAQAFRDGCRSPGVMLRARARSPDLRAATRAERQAPKASMRARWPGAEARRASQVTSGAPSASARATKVAS